MPKIDRSTDPALVRACRRHLGLTQQELGARVGCQDEAILGYERDGAPAWMRYALFGVAVAERGLKAEAAARLVGAEPAGPLLDHVPVHPGVWDPATSDEARGSRARRGDR